MPLAAVTCTADDGAVASLLCAAGVVTVSVGTIVHVKAAVPLRLNPSVAVTVTE